MRLILILMLMSFSLVTIAQKKPLAYIADKSEECR